MPLRGSGSSGFANPATTDLVMGSNDITFTGGNGIWSVAPSAGGAGIANAIALAKLGGGGIVQLEAGTYSVTSDINPTGQDYMCGVILRGRGEETVLEVNGTITNGVLNFAGATSNLDEPISNTSAGGASITVTTAANAGTIKAGDILVLKGTDTDSNADFETYHEAAADGNVVSGVVTLVTPVLKTLTSAKIAQVFGSEDNTYSAMNNGVEDLVIELVGIGASSAVVGLRVTYQHNFHMKNVEFRGWSDTLISDTDSLPISITTCLQGSIKDCKVFGAKNNGLLLRNSCQFTLDNNFIQKAATTGTSGTASMVLWGIFECEITNNYINNSGKDGIFLTGQAISRRNTIRGNKVFGCATAGISSNFDTLIENNYIERCPNDGAIKISANNFGGRSLVHGNRLHLNAYGIYLTAGCLNIVISNNIISKCISYGIICDQTETDVLIIGNALTSGGGGDPAISLQACTQVTVEGNIISSWTGRGIDFVGTGGCDECLVVGNKIRGTSQAGIVLSDASTDNLIAYNYTKASGITTGTGDNDFVGNKEFGS